MKFKLDENLPAAVAHLLDAHGHNVHTVLDESLGGSTDSAVVTAAGREDRVLVTLDRGFGDVRAYPPGTHPGIIVLRPDDQRLPSVLEMVDLLLAHHDVERLACCVTVVQRNVLRVRRPDPGSS